LFVDHDGPDAGCYGESMQPQQTDGVFEGSVPELYDQYLVPLIFESYANNLVRRLRPLAPSTVLEVAAGTGVVTRAMALGLPETTAITCGDLSQPMVDHAARVGTARPVTFQRADVMQLPFADNSFDAVVCQFGVMFFPDQTQAYEEIRRVLKPGGTFLFNTWDKNVPPGLPMWSPVRSALFSPTTHHSFSTAFHTATIGQGLCRLA
jgi:ubiquinone/menaquinone biosynthesis C-methylase UbiE